VGGSALRRLDLVTVDARIRLTSYAVFEADGGPARTATLDTALWALPDDEGDGVPGYRTRFTRMDVYAGAFAAGGAAEGHAAPLVWLSRADANQALLQGSVVVRGPDGSRRTFNVHENNGIAWDPAIKDPNRQARFWYFREVEGLLGVEQIPLRPLVTVAGDVYDLGLGKLVALSWEEAGAPRMQLAILADTGGAFEPNLFQLDWLAGTFPTMAAYQAWAASAPGRVRASVLLRKEGAAP
jgi:membrane-bound lytic murein transglycosylase